MLFIKKIKKVALLLIVFFVAFFVIRSGGAKAYTIDYDQICFPPYHVEGGYISLPIVQAGNYMVCQKYSPGKSMLASYIDIPLGYSSHFPAWIKVREASGNNGDTPGDIVLTYSATVDEDFWDGWKTFQRFYTANGEEASVDVNKYYWICLESEDVGLQWYYAKIDECDGYAMRGFGNSPELKLSEDMGYRTYGYNPDPVADPPPESEDKGDENIATTTDSEQEDDLNNGGIEIRNKTSKVNKQENETPDEAEQKISPSLFNPFSNDNEIRGVSSVILTLWGTFTILIIVLISLITFRYFKFKKKRKMFKKQ